MVEQKKHPPPRPSRRSMAAHSSDPPLRRAHPRSQLPTPLRSRPLCRVGAPCGPRSFVPELIPRPRPHASDPPIDSEGKVAHSSTFLSGPVALRAEEAGTAEVSLYTGPFRRGPLSLEPLAPFLLPTGDSSAAEPSGGSAGEKVLSSASSKP